MLNKRRRAEAGSPQRHVPKGVVSSISFLLCQLALQHGAAPTFVLAFDVSSTKWSRISAAASRPRATASCGRDLVIVNKGRRKKYSVDSASSDEEITSSTAPQPDEMTSGDLSSATDAEATEDAGANNVTQKPAADIDASDALLLNILSPSSDRNIDRIGPTQLAFVGDIVYELYVRCRYVWPSRRTTDLQSIVVNTVRAETQSKLLASMMKSFPFTDKEQSVLTRGRNASTGSRGRKRGKEWGAIYQDSTAFEALIGYVYMRDIDRCFEILDWIRNVQDEIDEKEGIHVQAASASRSGGLQYNTFLDLLRPRSDCDADRTAPAQLAYVGDSVYEMLVRNRYVWPTRRTADLHTKVVSVSRAETQASTCRSLIDENNLSAHQLDLTAKELSILSRGRNAAGGSGGRNKQVKKAGRAQQVDASMHQDAAALESLLAYTFIADPGRCYELLQWISTELDAIDAGKK